jgi:hypothetical protein
VFRPLRDQLRRSGRVPAGKICGTRAGTERRFALAASSACCGVSRRLHTLRLGVRKARRLKLIALTNSLVIWLLAVPDRNARGWRLKTRGNLGNKLACASSSRDLNLHITAKNPMRVLSLFLAGAEDQGWGRKGTSSQSSDGSIWFGRRELGGPIVSKREKSSRSHLLRLIHDTKTKSDIAFEMAVQPTRCFPRSGSQDSHHV